MRTVIWKQLTIAALILLLIVDCAAYPPDYSFRRYVYRKKSKSEKKIKAMRQQCETSAQCRDLYGLEQMRCTRRCMSAECYDELYGHDELEEGEVDVRFHSFKGCVLEKVPNS